MPEEIMNAQVMPGRAVIAADRDSIIGRRVEWMQNLPIFFNITPAECKEVVAVAHEKEFVRRQTIFLAGAPCKQVILVLSGCVKTTQLGPTGCEVILRLSGPGELVGALESYLGTNNLVTAKTTQSTTALVWDTAAFEHVSDRFPVLRRNTARLLGVRLQELEERFREISTQKVAPRLSQQLIRLSNQLRQHTKGALEISLSREELAQLTGTTLFTVSRLLSHWERQGIVSTRREAVVVRNLQALMQVSEAG
jgi:CRP/FNR family transcriptional regulator, nitrogen oxide reductase regulator